MSKSDNHIDDFIRNSFDTDAEDFDFNSWQDLEKRLDQDETVDPLVVSAFNNIAEEEVPSSVWDDVHDKLDIDTVWTRIDSALTNRKRRVLIWWNVASIAFGLIFLMLLFTDQSEQDPPLYTQSLKNSIEKSTSTNTKSSDSQEEQLIDELEKKGSKSKIKKQKEQNGQEELNPTIKLDATNAGLTDRQVNQHTNRKQSNQEQNRQNKIDFTEDKSSNTGLEISKLPVLKLSLAESTIPSSREFIEINEDQKDSSNTEITTKDEIEPIKKWSLGLTGTAMSTNLNDALSREANSANSLITPLLSMSYNPGIFIQYRTQNNWKLQADVYINYGFNRSLRLYEDLSHVTRSTRLTYQKVNLQIGKMIAIRPEKGNLFVETSLGVFTSYLSNQKEYRYNTLISEEKNLSRWNFGLDAELGLVHNLRQISFAYGAQINTGLLNISNPSNQSSNYWNRANTFSAGLYVRVGYRF